MSVYDAVAERIIKELEQGTVPWVKPWKTTLPYNAVSQEGILRSEYPASVVRTA